MSTQFEEPFLPEQIRDILEDLVVHTGHGPVSSDDRKKVDQAITETIAASQADQVALLERLHNILLGNDYVPAFSEDDEAVYKAKFIRDVIETEVAALRKGAK